MFSPQLWRCVYTPYHGVTLPAAVPSVDGASQLPERDLGCVTAVNGAAGPCPGLTSPNPDTRMAESVTLRIGLVLTPAGDWREGNSVQIHHTGAHLSYTEMVDTLKKYFNSLSNHVNDRFPVLYAFLGGCFCVCDEGKDCPIVCLNL